MTTFTFATQWLYLCATLFLFGSLFFIRFIADGEQGRLEHWRQKMPKLVVFFALVTFVSGLFLPAFQAIQVEGDSSAATNIDTWKLVLSATRFGFIWQIQQALSLLILIWLLYHKPLSTRFSATTFQTIALLLVTGQIFAGTLKSHASALEPLWLTLTLQNAHLLAAAAWLGSLPALYLLFRSAPAFNHRQDLILTGQALARFSRLATLMVPLVLASGIGAAIYQVEQWGELIATPYGQLLLDKTVLFLGMLCCGLMIRKKILPSGDNLQKKPELIVMAWRWIGAELFLGINLVFAASRIRETTPASHEETPYWPFDFRFSLEATWQEFPSIHNQVMLGLALFFAAVILGIVLWKKYHQKWVGTVVSLVAGTIGLTIALPPLTVDAYPETYRRTTVPYVAVSIANGERLFLEHCTDCHGVDATGNGPLAAMLPKPPANLTEPHTELHTAGDIFWWLTHGMPAGNMPGFKSVLDEDDRWDLINFLRTHSEGYEGRIITHTTRPEQPWLGAPDFYFFTEETSGNLRDFREQQVILLVFCAQPQCEQRLQRLAKNYPLLQLLGGEIIAVITQGQSNHSTPYPFTVITEETNDIARTYAQLRRSLQKLGDADNKDFPQQMEFLIDRFGYIRGRWIPEQTPEGWNDLSFLNEQVQLLAKEEQILPPPDDHVH